MSPRLITSHTNPTVKRVRALHMRKERQESGLFLAEGLKIVTEAVELGRAPAILMHGRDFSHPLLDRAIEATLTAGGEVIEVTQDILEKVSRRENPQAVVGVFQQIFQDLDEILPPTRLWLGLESVRDPGNLGTIIRTLDAAGAGGVVLIGDCCDPYSVEAVRATMGSIFAVPIAKANVETFLEWRAAWPGSVVGTLLTASQDHQTATYRAPALILMGNEQQGLTPDLAGACDLNVKIPMRGRADSLNLAVATGIMVYAASPD